MVIDMRMAVTGSIATDQLMVFPGSFSDHLLPDQLEQVSLSFLIDQLDVRRGGVAGNVCYGLGHLGFTPILVGAVGHDFEDYRSWLERHGVDTASVYVSDTLHTARFVCTTDRMQNQIGSFYAGAMAEARNIELASVADRFGGLDLVIIGPNDPVAMLRHTEECRDRGYPFAADVGQQVTRMPGDELRELVRGADYLLTNEYEHSLLLEKTGWSADEVLAQVGSWITTLGPAGVRSESRNAPAVTVPAVPAKREVDPTGIGDAFRVGYFAGLAWQLPAEQAMQLGCVLATTALEVNGPQEYTVEPDEIIRRLADVYGEEAAARLAPRFHRTDL